LEGLATINQTRKIIVLYINENFYMGKQQLIGVYCGEQKETIIYCGKLIHLRF
jgi:hypothetical protein